MELDRCLFNSSQDKTDTYITGGFLLTKIFLPGAEQADVYATVGAPVLEKMLSGQDQLLQKEARTFTLQGTESSPGLVPQLYQNLFLS